MSKLTPERLAELRELARDESLGDADAAELFIYIAELEQELKEAEKRITDINNALSCCGRFVSSIKQAVALFDKEGSWSDGGGLIYRIKHAVALFDEEVS